VRDQEGRLRSQPRSTEDAFELIKLFTATKNLAIRAGLTSEARWLSRRLRPARLRSFQADARFYQQILPKGSLVFDVGANLGDKSEALLAAGMRVVAFEPNPDVAPELKSRCQDHKDWSFLHSALGRTASINTFYARESHESSGLDPT
jgi:hypothetical protein